MDPERVFAVSRVQRRAGSHRRIQRQVHVQSVCPARRLVRDLGEPHSPHVSKLFPAGSTVAVHGPPARTGRRMSTARQSAGVRLTDYEPTCADFRSEFVAGLQRRPRRLPCKFFYDAVGSELFDRICEAPEYYPTPTELRILEEAANELAAFCGPRCRLVELGS